MPRLTLPLPPDSLRANRRSGQHWANVEREKERYQLACAAAVGTQTAAWRSSQAPQPVHLFAVLFLGYRQRCDPSDAGFWIKAGLDTLVLCGVFGNDSSAHINPFTAAVARDRENPRVEVYWGDGAASAAELAVSGRVVRVSRTRYSDSGSGP